MVRRTSPQKKTDEIAFPVRIMVAQPESGFGESISEIHRWLGQYVGTGQYAVYGAWTLAGDALGIYLRDVETARAFVAAFPALALADGTTSRAYKSPSQDGTWQSEHFLGVCNLYSMTRTQDAVRQLFPKLNDKTGNMPSLPGIFPDYEAPIVRDGVNGLELVMARWGMPTPEFALKNRKTDGGVTNIRNTKSPHWRRWLGVENRCLVPFTSFSENELQPDGSRPPVWFALDDTRPLAFFAGIWTRWTSVRKLKEGEVTAELFGFLTTEPNAEVGAVHPKAMPVILTTEAEREQWLTAPAAEALELQRSLPDGALRIVARGERRDG